MANDELYFITKNTLKEIADSIRAKKSITNALKPSNFAEEILSIEGGSSAKIIKEALVEQWTGTTIPREGTLETLYINYLYPVDSILAAFDSIPDDAYLEEQGVLLYAVGANEGYTSTITILKYVTGSDQKYAIVAQDPTYTGGTGAQIFYHNGTEYEWISQAPEMYAGPLFLSTELVPEITINFDDGTSKTIEVGKYNHLISNILSTTPVYYKSNFEGTAIPNNTEVETIYANFDLTIDEVIGIVTNPDINYTVIPNDDPSSIYEYPESVYGIVVSNDLNQVLLIDRLKKEHREDIQIYAVIGGTPHPIFDSKTGWNQEFVDLYKDTGYSFQATAVSSAENIEIGLENHLLSSLFSTTPFVEGQREEIVLEGDYDGESLVTKSKQVDLKVLVGQKKIPLTITFDVNEEEKKPITAPLLIAKSGAYYPNFIQGKFKKTYTSAELAAVVAANTYSNQNIIVIDETIDGFAGFVSPNVQVSEDQIFIMDLLGKETNNIPYPIIVYEIETGWYGAEEISGNATKYVIDPPEFLYRTDIVVCGDAALNLLLDSPMTVEGDGFNCVASLVNRAMVEATEFDYEHELEGTYNGNTFQVDNIYDHIYTEQDSKTVQVVLDMKGALETDKRIPIAISFSAPSENIAEISYDEGYDACEQETIDLLDDI